MPRTAADAGKGFSDARITDTSPDGLTWLDPQGNPPTLDPDGRLMQPFVLIRRAGDGYYLEECKPGLRLPPTRRQDEAGTQAITAARQRARDVRLSQADQLRIYREAIAALVPAGAQAPPAEEPASLEDRATAVRMLGELEDFARGGSGQATDRTRGVVDIEGPTALALPLGPSRPLASPPPARRGKLTREDAERIRARRVAGERPRDIAADYGVHPSTVSDIMAGRYLKA